jgi:MoaA/NifB/PqqE/SkfB family radical SAM enzyme
MNKESFTAASTFPAKLLHAKVIDNGKIIPIHIQLSPTNTCNLNCKFCSCSDRDKEKKLSLKQIMWILDVCSKRGTKSMTITGGGEPLLHIQINEIIKYANVKGIEVGLVTNGIFLDRLYYHPNLTWCRISSADDRVPAYETIIKAIAKNPNTDWAFSHVITKNPNYKIIRGLIDFANKNNFTHIRLVSDLLDLDKVPDIELTQENLKDVDDTKVIYQERKEYTRGTKNCYISLLKTMIAPEGIFPCCGTQYAIHGQPHDMVNKLSMGNIEDLPKILDNQKYFDGSICDVCYYQQYNQILSLLKERNVKHVNFV